MTKKVETITTYTCDGCGGDLAQLLAHDVVAVINPSVHCSATRHFCGHCWAKMLAAVRESKVSSIVDAEGKCIGSISKHGRVHVQKQDDGRLTIWANPGFDAARMETLQDVDDLVRCLREQKVISGWTSDHLREAFTAGVRSYTERGETDTLFAKWIDEWRGKLSKP
jgi:hypothetical protein